MIYNFDTVFFRALNSLAGRNYWFDWGIYLPVEIFPYILVLGVLCFLFFWKSEAQKIQNRLMVVEALATSLITRFFIAEPIRILVARERPFEVLSGVHQLVLHSEGKSFPSGHATFFFAVATVIFLYYRKTGIIFFFLALSLSMNRVIAGIHWPSDIFAGIALGIVIPLLIHYLKKYIPPGPEEKLRTFLGKY